MNRIADISRPASPLSRASFQRKRIKCRSKILSCAALGQEMEDNPHAAAASTAFLALDLMLVDRHDIA